MQATESPVLVSVIIPTFNSVATIHDTLESVLAQDYPNLEIIVVNDGSTDDVVEQLQKYGDKITLINQENAGQGTARNNGASLSKGEFLAFLDADDVWDNGVIAKHIKILNDFPEALASYCDHRVIDEHNNIMGHSGALMHLRPSGNITAALLYGACIITPGVALIRKTAWQMVDGFNEQRVMIGKEDYDFWLRLSLKGPIIYHPETLVSYRRHVSQITQTDNYELDVSKTRLLSLAAIEEDIQTTRDKNLQDFYQYRLSQSLLNASWAARQSGCRTEAVQYAWKNYLLKPFLIPSLKSLLKALV